MSKPYVLIVEDDEVLSELFANMMDWSGLETDVAQDGRVALEKLNQSPPDLVLLDLCLPHVSGLQILETIRSDENLKETPVVVVTADTMRMQDAEAMADLVLVKPVDYKSMERLIDRLLSR